MEQKRAGQQDQGARHDLNKALWKVPALSIGAPSASSCQSSSRFMGRSSLRPWAFTSSRYSSLTNQLYTTRSTSPCAAVLGMRRQRR